MYVMTVLSYTLHVQLSTLILISIDELLMCCMVCFSALTLTHCASS